MVEGGTLLRCYTSQRGIEGSNPSSSAPKLPHLQDNIEVVRRAGVSPGPIYTNDYTNVPRRDLLQDRAASIAAAVWSPIPGKTWL